MLLALSASLGLVACEATAATSTSSTSQPAATTTVVVTTVATTTRLVVATTGTVAPAESYQPPWLANAVHLRGMDGQQFDFDCPAGGDPAVAWGEDVYTDDSSVCTAAVHAGVITIEKGGTVTIEIRPGVDSYEGTTRNGIMTRSYPAWEGSYVVLSD